MLEVRVLPRQPQTACSEGLRGALLRYLGLALPFRSRVEELVNFLHEQGAELGYGGTDAVSDEAIEVLRTESRSGRLNGRLAERGV